MNHFRGQLAVAISLLATVGLAHTSRACNSVIVQSVNQAPESVGVSMNLNGTPADALAFNLGSTLSRTDTMTIGPGSADSLTLTAHITDHDLSADCQTPVVNMNNTAAMCSSVIDPHFMLTITAETSTSTSGSGSDSGSDSGSTSTTCSKHDNGNHIGEYRQLGLTVGVDVPFHNGKPGTKNCKDHITQDPLPKSPAPTPVTVTKLSCQFVPVNTKF